MFPRRPERLEHFDYRGPWRYSLTFCAARKHSGFIDGEIVGALIEQLLRTCDQEGFEPIAHCFMPDHLHMLVEGLEADSLLKDFCRLLRQRLAHEYAQSTDKKLWQPGYYERILRDDESTAECAMYIFGNPVRAGLARTILDYPFSGGTWFDKLRAEHDAVGIGPS